MKTVEQTKSAVQYIDREDIEFSLHSRSANTYLIDRVIPSSTHRPTINTLRDFLSPCDHNPCDVIILYYDARHNLKQYNLRPFSFRINHVLKIPDYLQHYNDDNWMKDPSVLGSHYALCYLI